MNELQLIHHIERFAAPGDYTLAVDCRGISSHISVPDRQLGLMLCQTARDSGVTKCVRFCHHPDAETEHILFDFHAPAQSEVQVAAECGVLSI